MLLALFFSLKIALAIKGLLWFHTKLGLFFSYFYKNNIIGIFIGVALTLQHNRWFWQFRDLNNIILVHEHRISLHLFVSSSILFINALQFSVFSFIRFITEYFIIFDAIVNEIGLFFSCSLLEYSLAKCQFYIFKEPILNSH